MRFNGNNLKELLETKLEQDIKFTLGKSKQGFPILNLENNHLYLELHPINNSLTIDIIETTIRGTGLGSQIYRLIEQFCIDNHYTEIVAKGFLDSGVNFWEKFNFKRYGDDYFKNLNY